MTDRVAYGTRHLSPPRGRGVRYRADVGFEMYCPGCARRGNGPRYWPITLEFWSPQNLSVCRACVLMYKSDYERRRRDGMGDIIREANRIYYKNNSSWLISKNSARRRAKRLQLERVEA